VAGVSVQVIVKHDGFAPSIQEVVIASGSASALRFQLVIHSSPPSTPISSSTRQHLKNYGACHQHS